MLQEFNLEESYLPIVGFLKCNVEWGKEDIFDNKSVGKEILENCLVFSSVIVIKTYKNPSKRFWNHILGWKLGRLRVLYTLRVLVID